MMYLRRITRVNGYIDSLNGAANNKLMMKMVSENDDTTVSEK